MVSIYIDASLCCLTKTQSRFIKSSVICVYVGDACSHSVTTLGPRPVLLISATLSLSFLTTQPLISVLEFLQSVSGHRAGKHRSTHMFTDFSLSCRHRAPPTWAEINERNRTTRVSLGSGATQHLVLLVLNLKFSIHGEVSWHLWLSWAAEWVMWGFRGVVSPTISGLFH